MPERNFVGGEEQKRCVMIWYQGIFEWQVANEGYHAGSSNNTLMVEDAVDREVGKRLLL